MWAGAGNSQYECLVQVIRCFLRSPERFRRQNESLVQVIRGSGANMIGGRELFEVSTKASSAIRLAGTTESRLNGQNDTPAASGGSRAGSGGAGADPPQGESIVDPFLTSMRTLIAKRY